MPESGKSGSVGAAGEQSPAATRQFRAKPKGCANQEVRCAWQKPVSRFNFRGGQKPTRLKWRVVAVRPVF